MTAENAIELHGVSYSRGSQQVFSDLSLSVAAGAITAVMGPSGVGKTTLLRLMMGQLQPSRGTVVVCGRNVGALSRRELFELRLKMGYLFQEGALFTDMTVFDNVAFPAREHSRLSAAILRALVLMKLQAVGLRGAAELMPAALSGGMARRVALARALVMDPLILLCDEPFTGLDPISTGVIMRLLQIMNETLGITVVIVSHDVPEVSAIAAQGYLLANGAVAAAGTPSALKQSGDAAIHQFMNGLPDGPLPFHVPAPDYFAQLMEESR